MRIILQCIIICFIQNVALGQLTIQRGDERVRYAPQPEGFRQCVYWRLVDGTTLYSTCDPYAMDRCGRRLTYAYQCCSGFQNDTLYYGNSVIDRCANVVSQWKGCKEIVSGLRGYGTFGEYLNNNHLRNGDSAVTIFAPYVRNQNDFVSTYQRYLRQGPNNPLYYHVVRGRHYARDLRNNQLLVSLYQGQKLKVTKYSFGVVCIECAELLDADLECKDGIIHQVRRILYPRTGIVDRSNLAMALQTDSRTKSFYSSLPADIQKLLSSPGSGNWYTVLAPTQEAWNKIKDQYSGRSKQLAIIARHHVFKKMYCSTSFFRSIYRLKSLSEEWVHFECSTVKNNMGREYEVRYASDMCGYKYAFLEQDMMSENGVIHVIDGVLVPLRARKFDEITKDDKCVNSPYLQIKTWINYIKECDLYMRDDKKYTVLLPISSGMAWWSRYSKFKVEYDKFMNDKDYRCRVARYHIAAYNDELRGLSSLWHEHKGYKTNNRNTRWETNYFLKYQDRSDLFFHYSKVINFENFRFYGGSIFLINRINVIPEETLVQRVKARSDLSIVDKFLTRTEYNEAVFVKNRPLNLYLAVRDGGFRDVRDNNWLPIIKYPKKYIMSWLMLHTVRLYLWGHDIGYFRAGSVHRFKSVVGLELIFYAYAENKMKIGYEGLPMDQWAEVVEFNIHAIDGIIWILEKYLPCPKKYCTLEIAQMVYLDLYVASCQISEMGPYQHHTEASAAMKKSPMELARKYLDFCVIYKQATKSAHLTKQLPVSNP